MAKKTYKKTIYPDPPHGRTQVGKFKFVNGVDGKPLNDLLWDKGTLGLTQVNFSEILITG